MDQEFWNTAIIVVWITLAALFVVGRVKWFWGLLFTCYSMLAVAALMFLSVGNSF